MLCILARNGRSHNKAFTIIELLTVIAIIAIFAAVMFPVYAQAKQSAKGSASLTNLRNIVEANMLYTNDFDDIAVMDEVWGDATAPIWYGRPGTEYIQWAYSTLPYSKNAEIFQDPLTHHLPAKQDPNLDFTYRPQYGYNYTLFSPVCDSTVKPWLRCPISRTTLANPAETVMFATKFSIAGWAGIWYGVSTLTTDGGIDPPDCNSGHTICFSGWGAGSAFETFGMRDEIEGSRTGGLSLRKSGHGLVAFADGHATSLMPARIASGTNWSRTLASSRLKVNDPSKYMWDAD